MAHTIGVHLLPVFWSSLLDELHANSRVVTESIQRTKILNTMRETKQTNARWVSPNQCIHYRVKWNTESSFKLGTKEPGGVHFLSKQVLCLIAVC